MAFKAVYNPVDPVRPIAPYVGGKRGLAKQVIARIEAMPHETYAEPFVGMGGVFLRRRLRPKSEVINDWSCDVATLFRVLQRHYQAFLDMIRWQITSRAEFERLAGVDPDTLTDLERAARFLYLQKTAFGGKVAGRTFGVSHGGPARFDVTKLGPLLEDLHTRLAGVIIEQLPWDKFLERYDRPGTLFYLDPPYYGSEGYYGRDMFPKDQFTALAAALGRVKGQFLVSLNDCPEVREIFAGFTIEAVSAHYSLSGGTGVTAGEVFITPR